MSSDEGVVQGRYESLVTTREQALKRARDAASLTVPHLMPPSGFNSTSDLATPYQSLGARGLRNLASKLLLSQLPPNTPFFSYQMDDYQIAKLEEEGGAEGRGEVEKALAKRERAVVKETEKASLRTAAFEVFRQLLVAGNSLIHIPEKGKAQVYRLDSYVVKRDTQGTALEIILKQSFSPLSLPEAAKAIVQAKSEMDGAQQGTGEASVDLYTYIRRTKKGLYEVYQEVCGTPIPGTRGTYPEEKTPWLALRLTKVDGQDYGRSYVEEYMGDLVSLEGLSQSLVEGTAAAARFITMVSPNGTTSQADIAQAENGDVISGNADEVQVLQADKRNDFGVAQQQMQEIGQRLSLAFLLNTAVQRNGERVTAEEIRFMAKELEDGLGGIYTLMADEFQMPLVKLFEDRMEKRKRIPKLPKGFVEPVIVVGIDALGRGQDLRNLDQFLVGLGEQFGPEVIGRYIKLSEAINRRGAALGIDMDGLVKTEEEVAEAEQQAQMQAMAQNLGPEAIKMMGGQAQNSENNASKERIAAKQQEGK